ncbi:N-formylglutamate amidohydrolase [Luedemannella helvata]|uniref:N-formylglutamate amidohydrolase n=1 Tax=Luedemannella helvata TaxID=349315 RepID=A0ABP4WS77_9ACTN
MSELVFRVHPGHPTSPVILHVPHASRRVTPAARASIVLDDGALAAELDQMTDAHTDLIAERAARAAATAPWRLVNLASRLVVDPERFPDPAAEEMTAVGMGAVYTRTSGGAVLRAEDAEVAERLLAAHFRPYAQGMTDLVNDRLAACGRAVIIDVHSYPAARLPYELHGQGPRPPICLGTDAAHTPGWLADAARDAFADLGVGWNTPFAGCYVPLEHYGRDGRVAAVMVEIRRDTYLTEPGGPLTGGADAVVRALAALIDAAG